MTIQEALQWGVFVLGAQESAFLDAELLLADALKVDRVFLRTQRDAPLQPKTWTIFQEYIKERTKKKPIAYILHQKKWADFFLYVDKNVLIPRDETEILCNKIVHKERSYSPHTFLDIGTGSGCIALFLKRAFVHANVCAVDISLKALRVAQKNAKKASLSISFLESDMLSSIQNKEQYDIIVANLPYVPQKMPLSLEVLQEPKEALFSGSDGLAHVRQLAQELQQKNIQFQELWLEFLPQQKEKIEQIFSTKKVEFESDCGGDVFFACVSPSK